MLSGFKVIVWFDDAVCVFEGTDDILAKLVDLVSLSVFKKMARLGYDEPEWGGL